MLDSCLPPEQRADQHPKQHLPYELLLIRDSSSLLDVGAISQPSSEMAMYALI